MELFWQDKPATRVPEALWLAFRPFEPLTGIRKLSQWIDPAQVIEKGGRRLHATDFGVRFGSTMEIASLDAPLVCPGQPELLDYAPEIPGLGEGAAFNLYNNVWGTNFVMWYDEDARFRFSITKR